MIRLNKILELSKLVIIDVIAVNKKSIFQEDAQLTNFQMY